MNIENRGIQDVIDYLELVGQASGDQILAFFGKDYKPHRLFTAVEEKEVMMTKNRFGQKWYTYPYPDEKEEAGTGRDWKQVRLKNRTQGILDYVERHPGANGREIKQYLDMTQLVADPLLVQLVDQGKLTRSKDGRSWRYSVARKSKVSSGDELLSDELRDRGGVVESHERTDVVLSEFEERVVKDVLSQPCSTASEVEQRLREQGVDFTSKKLTKTFSRLSSCGYLSRILKDDEETRYSIYED